jgi:hypothetical protein
VVPALPPEAVLRASADNGNLLKTLRWPWLITGRDDQEKPDYVVILAPLYAENIMKKNQAYKDGGGKFILIRPEVAVV